ncbi:hypothetical protein DDQ41_17390 [Streptomyces spongiicola]|uniref:Uncharacterized protein n=1 Tax=Streptomyces spongiicola TaxID=1690221 RepID=A0ABN5KQA5_9ACTN|nr:hypothetical protein DDQ41_17390 [Streptomyces spongiicola]
MLPGGRLGSCAVPSCCGGGSQGEGSVGRDAYGRASGSGASGRDASGSGASGSGASGSGACGGGTLPAARAVSLYAHHSASPPSVLPPTAINSRLWSGANPLGITAGASTPLGRAAAFAGRTEPLRAAAAIRNTLHKRYHGRIAGRPGRPTAAGPIPAEYAGRRRRRRIRNTRTASAVATASPAECRRVRPSVGGSGRVPALCGSAPPCRASAGRHCPVSATPGSTAGRVPEDPGTTRVAANSAIAAAHRGRPDRTGSGLPGSGGSQVARQGRTAGRGRAARAVPAGPPGVGVRREPGKRAGTPERAPATIDA